MISGKLDCIPSTSAHTLILSFIILLFQIISNFIGIAISEVIMTLTVVWMLTKKTCDKILWNTVVG